MLEINATLLVQICNFLLLVFILNIILYRPIRRVIRRRHEETDALQSAIEQYQRKAEENEQGIEESRVAARREGFNEKERLKGEGQEEVKKVMQEASSSMEHKMGAARKEMDEKVKDVKGQLETEIGAFSRELAEKILGRSVQ